MAVRFVDQPQNTATMKLEESQPHRASMTMSREQSQMPDDQDGQSLFSNPMGSLYEVTRLRGLRGSNGGRFGPGVEEMESDFVSRGLITPTEAQDLFAVYVFPAGESTNLDADCPQVP